MKQSWQVNKLTATIGTRCEIGNCEVTSWILSGWSFIRQLTAGTVELEKIR